MIQILWGILIILNLWGGSSDAAVSSDLLAFSAGRVMDHVVTSREVKINYVVESVLYGKRGGPLSGWVMPQMNFLKPYQIHF